MNLTETQERILSTQGNLIVRASAGTGKTFILTEKVKRDLKLYKGFKSIATITFTIKAAKEIRDKLTVDKPNHFIGTTNRFVVDEIVIPFLKDAYGREYHHTDLETDYMKIIQTFDQGLRNIREEKVLCAYPTGMKKNFIFELAYEIVKKSEACRLYLQAKYKKIYIDEFQDCDSEMRSFFLYLCDELGIESFYVGDDKQSIYMWRGADPRGFLDVWNRDDFEKISMRENHRSCIELQNYSNLLCEDTRDLFDVSIGGGNNSVILLKTSVEKWGEKVVQILNPQENATILRYRNNDAKRDAEHLTTLGRCFTYIPQIPISEIRTRSGWLYMAIAQYVIIENYSVYDFMNEAPLDQGSRKIRNGIIKNILERIVECKNNFGELAEAVRKIGDIFNCEIREEHIQKLYETIIDEEYYPTIIKNYNMNLSMTFHSSKGLEFDQVVIFAEDYRLDSSSSIYNHYVASTRARSKLIIVLTDDNDSWNVEQFEVNLTKIFSTRNLSIDQVLTVLE